LKHVSNSANDPFIQINLGDLYLARNISGDAKRAYSTAIQAAANENDPFSEAFAQHALGMILKFEGAKPLDACKALTRAIQLYRDLGEIRTADLLQSELESLSSIKNILPSSAAMRGAPFTLIVNGTGFIPSSVVNWNGTSRITTFVSATQLKVNINATDLTSPGIINITVTNPPPCSGASNPQPFTVQNATNNPSKDD
jgi:tetratricopeptide (TPR) repeat protein